MTIFKTHLEKLIENLNKFKSKSKAYKIRLPKKIQLTV